MEWLTEARWSPYIVGAGIGILSWLMFLLVDRPIGCSTAFARTSGMIERMFRGKSLPDRPYYREFPPVIDWEWMLVLGLLAGAFLSAQLSGTFNLTMEHPTWTGAFGRAPVPRLLVALIGGTAMGFGARWAGGCTSGHGISGTMQWTISSWVASICFFAGGIVTAWVLFHLIGGGGA